MDIEKIATSELVSSLSKTNRLSGFINSGDKEPCWDGNIYIYENSRRSKNNLKRMPTQVKGKAVERKAVKDNIRYRVAHEDLKAYMMDGGILFFVVYIDKKTGDLLQIYYADLLPVNIRDIIKQKNDSYSINFTKFPSDNKKKIEIVLEAYDNASIQKGFAGKKLPTIDDLSKEGLLESITFNVTHIGESITSHKIPQIMKGKSITICANIKGTHIVVPVDYLKNITHVTSYQEIDKKVYVDEKEYYNKYGVTYSDSTTQINIGTCMTIKAPIFDENTNEKLLKTTIYIKVRGTLKERIKGIEFIKAVFDNDGFEIEGNHFQVLLKKEGYEIQVQKLCEHLENLKYINKLFENMHVKKDVELDDFSEEDEKNLNLLIGAIGGRRPVRNRRACIENIQLLKISNITLGVIYIKHSDGKYYMHDYFGNHLDTYYKNNGEGMHTSQFAILKADDFLKYDNIYLPMIIEDFKIIPVSYEFINIANHLMLEMIKAYDQSYNSELLDIANQTNDWLKEYPQFISEEICVINEYQIRVRQRKLMYKEQLELLSIAEKTSNMNYKVAALIILGHTEEVRQIFDSFDANQMDEFKSFPIYSLYQQNADYARN